MFVICALSVVINAGGIPFLVNADTKGKVINQSETNYLVDFSVGVKHYRLKGTPSDYKEILIEKKKCVEL